MGRRKMEPDKVKNQIIKVRVDYETMVALSRVSELTGKNKSEIIRDLIQEEVGIVNEMNRLGRFK